ncbi:hypothetical protein MMC16_001149 [Acarospora aff. strigata]|nr:hypothetical protein [Acarospora aff. strigata]
MKGAHVVETRYPEPNGLQSSSLSPAHGAPEVVGGTNGHGFGHERTVDEIEASKTGWFAYFKTKDFYIVLVLGQVLALCITATNTFSGLLVGKGTSIPAFQTFFNYVLLNIVYTSYTIYKHGFKGWSRLIFKDGWKCGWAANPTTTVPRTDLILSDFLLAFMDVEGNYFTVLAYRYTTILSAQLINFWAIVVVVVLSFFVLRVRYHITQVIGILICVGGMGILLGSDHITGSNGGDISSGNQLKGDLFALLGATFYGLANVTEEFLVSKRPLYEVVGQLGFWAMLINGTQAGIFDRASFRAATWDGQVAGYLVGYTLCLFLFYTLAPLMFRLASAAFFNISLLTGNFWGVVIGIEVFGLTIHFLYPIAFVCIMIGLVVYFVGKQVLGEAKKPWLGRNQERGVSGVGTARRKVERPDAIV